MKLNILTVLFRKDFLQKQYDTIPKKKDVNWIICKTKSWGEIPENIQNSKEVNVLVAEVDCIETRENFIKKINFGFQFIEDGFFYILDDDNCFHDKTYETFTKYKNSIYEMIIGKQIRSNGKTYLNAVFPRLNSIDMGNVICTTKILKEIDYFNKINPNESAYDGRFWEMCGHKIGKEKTILIDETIFFYNGLR